MGKNLKNPLVIKIPISETSSNLFSLYIPTEVRDKLTGDDGRIQVQWELNEGEPQTASGTLRANALLGGMARLYSDLGLKPGDEIKCLVIRKGLLKVERQGPSMAIAKSPGTVAEIKRLKNIHFPPFSPHSFDDWTPQTEVDVYMAFGQLQEQTRYKYCCGASKTMLDRWGYRVEAASKESGVANAKPDAILLDGNTGEYLIAEFKPLSSDFPSWKA